MHQGGNAQSRTEMSGVSRNPTQKELCLARRRRDAEFRIRFSLALLCASASLRALVLVAAEGRATSSAVRPPPP